MGDLFFVSLMQQKCSLGLSITSRRPHLVKHTLFGTF